MGVLKDKNHLVDAYAQTMCKANITGYCIKFRKLRDINLDVRLTAIRYSVAQTNP